MQPSRPDARHPIPTTLAILFASGLTVAAAAQTTAPQPAPTPAPTKPEATKPEASKPETTKPVAPDANVAPKAPRPSDDPTPEQYRDAEADVFLRSSGRVTGIVKSYTKETLVLEIAGVTTTFSSDDVREIRVLPPVEERYKELHDAIADDDVENLIQFADWLRARNRIDLAIKEIDRALAADPLSREAKELKSLLVAQRDVLEATKKAAQPKSNPSEKGPEKSTKPSGTPEAKPNGSPDPKADTKPAFPLLSDRDINIMRFFEIDLKDPPRMIISRDTITSFLTKYAGQSADQLGTVPDSPEGREQFYRMKPAELLPWFYAFKARDLYEEVKVLENPKAFINFRDDVHRTWLTNSCATSKCHGGAEAGRLFLATDKPNADATIYTNFLILDRFKTKDGFSMIDFEKPARSILLQMALPAEDAIFKHPDLPSGQKVQPVFRGKDDPRFEKAVAWIRSMYPTRTDYPVKYTPPTAKPALTPAKPKTTDSRETPPATKPATPSTPTQTPPKQPATTPANPPPQSPR